MAKMCLDCGAPGHRQSDRGAILCASCRRTREAARNASRAHIYDAAWARKSREARALQGWCTRCGSTLDLTLDHETGTVECRSCNSSHQGTTVPSRNK